MANPFQFSLATLRDVDRLLCSGIRKRGGGPPVYSRTALLLEYLLSHVALEIFDLGCELESINLGHSETRRGPQDRQQNIHLLRKTLQFLAWNFGKRVSADRMKSVFVPIIEPLLKDRSRLAILVEVHSDDTHRALPTQPGLATIEVDPHLSTPRFTRPCSPCSSGSPS